jgi:pimeloyl-ACP methyl ester carboxylesterase
MSTTPVLVIHARDDHHVPVDFALAALAAHPVWAAAILDRGGHHLHVEDPDGWLGAAIPWLNATAPHAV